MFNSETRSHACQLQEEIFTNISKTCGTVAQLIARDIYFKSKSAEKTKRYGIEYCGRRWFHEIAEYFAKKHHICVRTVYTALKKLKDSGYILIKKFFGKIRKHTNWYSWAMGIFTSDSPKNQSIENPYVEPPFADSDPAIFAESLYNTTTTNNYDFENSDEEESLATLATLAGGKDDEEDPIEDEATLEKLGKTALRIWNEEEIAIRKCFAKGTPKNIKAAAKAMIECFDQDIDIYKRYLKLLTTSPYLMGSSFVMRIPTALSPLFIERIFDGELGVDKEKIAFPILSDITIKEMIDKLHCTQEERLFRHRLASIIGHQSYHSWLHNADAIPVAGNFRMRTSGEYTRQRWGNLYTEGWDTLRRLGLIEC